MKRVLLIGGAGYVGSVIADYFLQQGAYTVRCLDNLIYGNHAAARAFIGRRNYEFVNGDFCDADVMKSALQDVDYVVLLAGLVGDPITKKFPDASGAINETGVQNCIDLCAASAAERFIFISTCSNYGLIQGDQLADEEFELKPLSLYAKAKVAAEKHILSLRGTAGFCPTVLRFATAFGASPRMRFDLTISEFTRDLAMGKELLVFDAETWRPYCHVGDFARLIHMVLTAEPEKVAFEVFNAGDETNNARKQDIIDAILESLPDAQITYQAQGPDPRNYRVDFTKVRERLGFRAEYTIRDGIQEVIGGVENGLFSDEDDTLNRYGNYHVSYT